MEPKPTLEDFWPKPWGAGEWAIIAAAVSLIAWAAIQYAQTVALAIEKEVTRG